MSAITGNGKRPVPAMGRYPREEKIKHRTTQIILPVAVLMFIATTALAQMPGSGAEKRGMMEDGMMGGDAGMHGMMEGPHDMGMEMGGMMDMMKMMKAMSRLDLIPDQKKKLQSLSLAHQKETIPLFSRIRTADVEIQEFLMAEPVDWEKVKAKAREKHDAMAKLDVSHLTTMQQVKALLNPEQRQRLDSMMMEMGPMMGAPSGEDEKRAPAMPKTPAEGTPKTTDPHGH